MSGFVLVCLGAGVGAPARYVVDRAVQARHDTVFPWGTLTANVVGSLVLGVLSGLSGGGHLSPEASLAVGTGLCGAFTTYSTFSYETFRLLVEGARLFAALNVAVSVLAGLGAAMLGHQVGAAL